MLPAYVAYYLPRAPGERQPLARAVVRGLAGGSLAALGAFLVLLAIAALALALGAPFRDRVVWLELVGGLLVGTMGVLVLTGRGPALRLAIRPSTRRGALGIFSFGALYAAVAASCVAPVFLGVVVQATVSPTPLGAALAILAYGAGLGTLLVAATIAITTAQDRVVATAKRWLPLIEKASGVVLLVVGAYLVYFWATVALG